MSKRVEKLQTRALRFVYLDSENDYNSLLERAKIYSLYINRKRKLLTEVFKIINQDCPSLLYVMFTLKISKRIFRRKNSVIVLRRNTTRYGLNSFTYLGAKLWNRLPNHIKTIADLQEFKRNLIDVTFDNCRCNICKFFDS